jgi:hypothetical protein
VDIDLQQGLGEIADDAPTAHLTADTLWRQGIRRRNRRRVGAVTSGLAVLALVAAAVGVAATPGLLRTEQPPPASATREAHLPARVWQASGWTPGTDEAGDPGRIAVLYWDNGRRRSLVPFGIDAGGGYVAVSAVDGEYRYLDLPGLRFDNDAVALSPDGRYVAYALRSAGPDDPAAVTTGWAVYDAQTGRVAEHRPRDTPKGVGIGGLAWSPDSRTLLADVCVVTQVDDTGQSCGTRRADAWTVATGEVREVTGAFASEVVGHVGADLLLRSGRQLKTLDLTTGASTRIGRVGKASETGVEAAFVDRARGVVTVATSRYEGGDQNDGTVTVDSGSTVLLAVDRERLADASSLGGSRVLVRGAGSVDPLAAERDGSVVALVNMPSRLPAVTRFTGSGSTELTRFQPGWAGALPQVATDLLARPTVPGTRPPDVRDPWAVGGGAALGLAVLAGLGLAWVRRRRGVTL